METPIGEWRIVAKENEHGGRDVELIDSDGRTTGYLCAGELLEQVIGLVYPGFKKVYPMKTTEEWDRIRLHSIKDTQA